MTVLRRGISVLMILCLAYATTVAAATAQWSVNNLTYVHQIYNDGAGGCAFYASNASGEYIAWYNSKGEKIYDKQITTSTMGLVSVDKKYLVFTIDSGSGYTLMQVDKKGVETPIAPAGVQFYPGMPGMHHSNLGDKKGYFIVEMVTATGEYRVRRYTYK